MSWDTLFGLTNAIALAGWIVLLVMPRRPLPLAFVLYVAVGLLCLIYAAMFVASLGRPGTAGFEYSVPGLKRLFAADGAIVIGWTHYLALDLFAGSWIARDADNKGVSRIVQAPILIAAFLAGPMGLLIWLIVREPAARRANPRARR